MNTLEQQVEQFADKLLIHKKTHKHVEGEALEAIRDDLINQIQVAINVSLLASIPEADADKCVELLKAGKDEKVASIIDKKSKNTAAVITAALSNFREGYLTGAL